MQDETYCAQCGVQILTSEDLGGIEEDVTVRPNLVGVPAVGATAIHTEAYHCKECRGSYEHSAT